MRTRHALSDAEPHLFGRKLLTVTSCEIPALASVLQTFHAHGDTCVTRRRCAPQARCWLDVLDPLTRPLQGDPLDPLPAPPGVAPLRAGGAALGTVGAPAGSSRRDAPSRLVGSLANQEQLAAAARQLAASQALLEALRPPGPGSPGTPAGMTPGYLGLPPGTPMDLPMGTPGPTG